VSSDVDIDCIADKDDDEDEAWEGERKADMRVSKSVYIRGSESELTIFWLLLSAVAHVAESTYSDANAFVVIIERG
jgi:hypothetical protein